MDECSNGTFCKNLRGTLEEYFALENRFRDSYMECLTNSLWYFNVVRIIKCPLIYLIIRIRLLKCTKQ